MDSFDEFLDRLRPVLEKFLHSPSTSATKSQLNSTLASSFAESNALGEVFLPFDGMRVTGGVGDFNGDRVDIRWVTEFFPGPRFGLHQGDCRALGFFGDFDLYVADQRPLPPTLIAKYGRAPGDYATFNPAMLGVENISQHGEHFAEALRRALFINYDLGL